MRQDDDPSRPVRPVFFKVILPPITQNIMRVERHDRRAKDKPAPLKDVDCDL